MSEVSQAARPTERRASVLQTAVPRCSARAGSDAQADRPTLLFSAQHRDKRVKAGPVLYPMDEPLLKKCDSFMKGLLKRNQAVHFLRPVDWKKMGLHDYPKLIKQPMDLGTVAERLSRNAYGRLEDFANEIRLVWVRDSRHDERPRPGLVV